MHPQMTDFQLDFYRRLQAPFPEEVLSDKPGRGGKVFTFIEKRAIENRLDEVCGPHGWKVKYRETKRGFVARMGILCPIEDGEWGWVWKEDGAGYEEMDAVDDDEKSGYTNAFRRVAQDPWGIGRYLYRKGVPGYIQPDAAQSAVTWLSNPRSAPRPPSSSPASPAPARPQASNPAPAPADKPRPASPPKSGVYDNFKIPKPGKSVFAWAKSMETHYATTLVDGIKRDGVNLGFGPMMNEWNQGQVNVVCSRVIDHLRSLDNYKGEFGYDEGPAAATPPAPSPAPKNANPPADLQAARSQLASALTTLVTEQLGRKPTVPEIKEALAQHSPDVANGAGSFGEVMASVGACDDAAWIANMTDYVAKLTLKGREAAKVPEEDIPF